MLDGVVPNEAGNPLVFCWATLKDGIDLLDRFDYGVFQSVQGYDEVIPPW